MSFQDIFKNSFLESATSFSVVDTVVSLLLAFILGLAIYFVYKLTYQGVVYSRTFGVSLVALSMITTLIILAVTSNVVLSLGMVGALSIVRFRTAVKDPLDIVFLFWSVGTGIVLGATMYPLAVLGTLVVGIILLLFVPAKSSVKDFILVVNLADEAAEKKVHEIAAKETKALTVKTKTVAKNYLEVTYEIKITQKETDFVNKISALEGVDKAVLVSYNGDYMA